MSTARISPLDAVKPAPALEFQRKPSSIRSFPHRRVDARPILDRVRGEFAEMRGFCPTLAQAARLFDLAPDECARVLGALIKDGSLRRDETGRYRLM